MQIEGQNQAVASSEIVLPVESKKSRGAHGGKRLGSGRKPNAANIVLKGTTRAVLLQALENVDPQLVAGRVTKLLNSKREVFWLQTLNFIYDRILGKPKQDVNVSGAFLRAEVRDPVLLGWPKEGLSQGRPQVRLGRCAEWFWFSSKIKYSHRSGSGGVWGYKRVESLPQTLGQVTDSGNEAE